MADGISVDGADLARYHSHAGTLSGDIVGAAKKHLAGNLSLPGNLFGDLGHESGLQDSLTDHLDRMHTHVHSVAGGVHDLGQSVHTAKGDYEHDEQVFGDTFRRILG
ncbi:hypothetical protein [Amycolatopsis pithecellobii]|uniref:ESX-1 secretion-associated protein n=1 Tax=Amycolatopsis pithecellobii TaxID=664692 RepID=A0A6N7Z6P6_9PSEU|nr:hypothetical protein [Amycolatopsis pithecellobii]MTD56624.1 hypothetical protein [Amycolatopsis pithecellobii]